MLRPRPNYEGLTQKNRQVTVGLVSNVASAPTPTTIESFSTATARRSAERGSYVSKRMGWSSWISDGVG